MTVVTHYCSEKDKMSNHRDQCDSVILSRDVIRLHISEQIFIVEHALVGAGCQ